MTWRVRLAEPRSPVQLSGAPAAKRAGEGTPHRRRRWKPTRRTCKVVDSVDRLSEGSPGTALDSAPSRQLLSMPARPPSTGVRGRRSSRSALANLRSPGRRARPGGTGLLLEARPSPPGCTRSSSRPTPAQPVRIAEIRRGPRLRQPDQPDDRRGPDPTAASHAGRRRRALRADGLRAGPASCSTPRSSDCLMCVTGSRRYRARPPQDAPRRSAARASRVRARRA